MRILSFTDEPIATADSDAEACRFWLEGGGRKGDWIEETGEGLENVVLSVFPNATWSYDQGAVVRGSVGE